MGCLKLYDRRYTIGITSSAAVQQVCERARAVWIRPLDAQSRGNIAARAIPPDAILPTGIEPAILPYLTAPPIALTR